MRVINGFLAFLFRGHSLRLYRLPLPKKHNKNSRHKSKNFEMEQIGPAIGITLAISGAALMISFAWYYPDWVRERKLNSDLKKLAELILKLERHQQMLAQIDLKEIEQYLDKQNEITKKQNKGAE
jgi:hypothetical protein